MTTSSTLHRLIVDTDSYAGNFERQSIAYATGLVGDCGVGQGEALTASEEVSSETLKWWGKHGQQVADDHGCMRPAKIHPTPGFFNHGMGVSFPLTDEGRAAALVSYKEVVEKYESDQIKRLDLVEIGKHGWTVEAVERERASRQKKIDDANAMTAPNEYPSYQSVAIQVDQVPPPQVIKEFEERMTAYLTSKGVKVLDFALETEAIQVQVTRSPIVRA